MTNVPKAPLFLQAGKAKLLNDKLVLQTGCFAFLKTDQVLFSTMPETYQDAFTIYTLGLYSLYHDYGCYFLRLLLEDFLCPPSIQTYRLRSYRTHVGVVTSNLRHNIAHGILEVEQRKKIQRKLSKYYLDYDKTEFSPEQWPFFTNSLSPNHWEKITNRLVADSDNLYNFLELWANEWAKIPDGLANLRDRFARNEKFCYSFDRRICEPIIRKHNSTADIKRYINLGDSSSDIYSWRETLREDFLSKSITAPEEIYEKLNMLIDKTVNPPHPTSIDSAGRYGFGIPN